MTYSRHSGYQSDEQSSVGVLTAARPPRGAMSTGVATVTVFVDDHEVVRRGLIDLLSADPEPDVIGQAGTVAHAMAQIPVLRPDVAVLDVRLPDGNGIELCRDLLYASGHVAGLARTS